MEEANCSLSSIAEEILTSLYRSHIFLLKRFRAFRGSEKPQPLVGSFQWKKWMFFTCSQHTATAQQRAGGGERRAPNRRGWRHHSSRQLQSPVPAQEAAFGTARHVAQSRAKSHLTQETSNATTPHGTQFIPLHLRFEQGAQQTVSTAQTHHPGTVWF